MEQEELSTLKESNDELERRIRLLGQQEITDQKNAAVAAVKAVTTEFGDKSISDSAYSSSAGYWKSYVLATTDDAHARNNGLLLAAYEEAQKLFNNAKDITEKNTYNEVSSDIRESLLSNLSDLYEQKDAMSDYYNYIKGSDISLLDDEDLSVIQQYERIVADIDKIYQALDPASAKADKLEKY